MSGSCPIGADVCRDAHAEVDRLAAENARLREEVDARTTGQRDGKWADPEGDYWRDNALLNSTKGETNE